MSIVDSGMQSYPAKANWTQILNRMDSLHNGLLPKEVGDGEDEGSGGAVFSPTMVEYCSILKNLSTLSVKYVSRKDVSKS